MKRIIFFLTFCCLYSFALQAQDRLRSSVGFFGGFSQGFSNPYIGGEIRELKIYHPVRATYGAYWQYPISSMWHLRFTIRSLPLSIAVKHFPLRVSEYAYTAMYKGSSRFAPTLLELGMKKYLISPRKRVNLYAYAGFAIGLKGSNDYQYESKYFTPSESFNTMILTRRIRTYGGIATFVSAGIGSEVRLFGEHYITLETLLQGGYEKIGETGVEYYLNGFTSHATRTHYGTNLSVQIGYRMPLSKKKN